jgi:hypothetical protein
MARIRTIKPDFWTDEKIVELSAFARLLFIGLWNFADDDGRMVYSPKKIKMQIFPGDSLDILELFGEIRGKLLVDIYTIDCIDYLQVSRFSKHQKIDKRAPSKYPANIHPPRIPPNPPDGREGNGMEMEGKGMEGGMEGKGMEGKKDIASPAPAKKQNSKTFTPPVGDELLSAWNIVRSAKRAGAITSVAWSAVEREAAKAGISTDDAVRVCVERSWISFKAEWYQGGARLTAAQQREANNRQSTEDFVNDTGGCVFAGKIIEGEAIHV